MGRKPTLILLVVCLAAIAAASPAAAKAPTAAALAERLHQNDLALRDAIDDWRVARGDPPAGQAPDEVMDRSLYVQRKVRYLAKRHGVAKRVLRELRAKHASQMKHFLAAARKLRRLSGGGPPRKLKVGKPRPLSELMAHYRKAQRLYGVGWHYLAAINLVETKFGRVKSKSVAGARGPMQFIPSTWRIYGNGGNIQDPHDAILAAARLLKDHGAPRNYGRALYHYNPSQLYVSAVSRYARQIARDRHAVAFLYCWGP
jgi:membrane-bound lytic murein transglycosylase B